MVIRKLLPWKRPPIAGVASSARVMTTPFVVMAGENVACNNAIDGIR